MMNFRFSLLRMFMAVTAFCMAFAFVKVIGAPWPICPWLIGVPLALLMLVAKRAHLCVILHALITCGIGVCLGVGCCEWSMSGMRDGGYDLAVLPSFALLGVLLTCFVRYFIIGFAKWHYNIRHSYWEEYDAKSRSAESQEIIPSKSRELCP